MKHLGRLGTGIVTVVVALTAAAFAGDPPARVARLQYMSGEVSLQPGGVNDWVPGAINRPLTTADRLWADKNSRAELQLGTGAVRVSSETSMTLTNISDGIMQVELDQGTINLWVRRLYHGETYEIDTPNMAFTVMKAGEYRFDVDPNGDTSLVTVWRGEGEASGQGRAVRVKHGQTARFTRGNSLAHDIYEARGRDGFDDWCQIRDRREQYSPSVRYAPNVIGVEDLDDYGSWHVAPAYGAMWVPAVGPGWAPYHYGHWAWIEPWGWTWIDDAPWGFAPCHYGRWVYYSGYWGWVPGPVVVQPVYAPALVAWVGGSNWGVSFAFGSGPAVGWFPLGYGEPYLPPYRVSPGYFRNVNVTNTRITNITNVTNNYYNTTNINSNNVNSYNTTTITKNNTTIVTNNTTNITKNTTDNSININGNHNNVHINYANAKVPGAVTAVPGTVLTNSQPVAKAAMSIAPGQVKETAFVSAPPVAPSRNSVLGGRAGMETPLPPAAAESRHVVERTPAPPKPVPFYVKEQELAKNPGRPVDPKVEDELRTQVQRNPQAFQVEHEAKQPPMPARVEPKAVANPEMRPNETPTAGATPMHPVPRPPVSTEPVSARPATAEGNLVGHPAEQNPGVRTDTARPAEHMVPRPPVRSETQSPAAVAERPVESPAGRAAGNVGTPQSEIRIVPRPPERNTSQPNYEPVVSSPRAEPRLIPQPQSSSEGERGMPRRDPVQPHPVESVPSAPRPMESRPERGPAAESAPRQVEGGGRPTYEPRTEHPAREAAPSGAREARPSAPSPGPASTAPGRSDGGKGGGR